MSELIVKIVIGYCVIDSYHRDREGSMTDVKRIKGIAEAHNFSHLVIGRYCKDLRRR